MLTAANMHVAKKSMLTLFRNACCITVCMWICKLADSRCGAVRRCPGPGVSDSASFLERQHWRRVPGRGARSPSKVFHVLAQFLDSDISQFFCRKI